MAELTKQEELDIKKLFEVFDKDRNNYITLKELKAGLRVFHGENPTETQIKEIYQSMNLKEGSKIKFDDFRNCLATFTQKKKTQTMEEKMASSREAFKVFDRDSNGFINKQELRRVLQKFGDGMSDAEINEMFRIADVNNDGEIDYNEYVKIIHQEVKIS